MKQEFNILMIIFFITLFLKYGLETDWIKFKKQVKKEIIKILNLLIIKIVFILWILFWSVYFSIYYIINKKFDVSDNVLLWKSIGLFLPPILAIFIYFIFLFLFWISTRSISFILYKILQKIFKISEYLNNEQPLKPFLLMLQVVILVLSPIIAFLINIFSGK